MKNWAGNLVFDPSEVITPGSVEEIKAAVKKASLNKKKIRTRGTGHSWTGLITTQDIFIHLDKLQGVLEVNKANKTIKAYAGTKLFVFGEEAFIPIAI